jgi:hypothetical protein
MPCLFSLLWHPTHLLRCAGFEASPPAGCWNLKFFFSSPTDCATSTTPGTTIFSYSSVFNESTAAATILVLPPEGRQTLLFLAAANDPVRTSVLPRYLPDCRHLQQIFFKRLFRKFFSIQGSNVNLEARRSLRRRLRDFVGVSLCFSIS